MHIRNLRFINKKGVNRNSSRGIVPVCHHIFLSGTHGKSTSLHKNESWSRFHILGFHYAKIALGFVVIVPSGYSRFFGFFRKNATGGYRAHNCN